MALFAGDFHTIRRVFVYGLLWIVSVVLLGLTASRVSLTRSQADTWETYVALLLADAVLTMIWVPLGWFMLFHERFSNRYGVHHELIGAGILWLLWLVGAAGFTNTVLPGTNYCSNVVQQCQILGAILAFGWMGWSLLTILLILSLMGQAAAGATVVPAEKRGATIV